MKNDKYRDFHNFLANRSSKETPAFSLFVFRFPFFFCWNPLYETHTHTEGRENG